MRKYKSKVNYNNNNLYKKALKYHSVTLHTIINAYRNYKLYINNIQLNDTPEGNRSKKRTRIYNKTTGSGDDKDSTDIIRSSSRHNN